MRFSIAAAALALLAPFAFAAPSHHVTTPSVELDLEPTSSLHNLTARTLVSTWTFDQCDRVKGTAGIFPFAVQYDLGCICLGDVDNFCYHNGLSSIINSWIRSYLKNAGSYKYPTGSQPTCDDQGGYTCPIAKDPVTGFCTSQAVSCGNGYTLQSDGSCCPRSTTKINGQCCATTCSGASNGNCYGAASCTNGKTLSNGLCCASGTTGYTKVCCPSGQQEDPASGQCICSSSGQKMVNGACVAKCSSGTSWCTTQCCKSYMSESNGQCVCPAGQKDNGSACVAICTSQQNFNPTSSLCTPKCGGSLTWSSSSMNPAGLCCEAGTTCQKTKCCANGQFEGDGGVCCPIGSTVSNGKCVAPSGSPKKTRRSVGGSARAQKPIDKAYLKIDEKLCPTNLSACPVPGAKSSSSYECLDSFTDINSCGGCTSMGRGQDCTSITGAKWMGCEQGSCVVYSCRRGFKLVGTNQCEKI